MKYIFQRKAANDNKRHLSIFDVMELYEAAYAENEKKNYNPRKVRVLLHQAALLDCIYRRALKTQQPFGYGEVA